MYIIRPAEVYNRVFVIFVYFWCFLKHFVIEYAKNNANKINNGKIMWSWKLCRKWDSILQLIVLPNNEKEKKLMKEMVALDVKEAIKTGKEELKIENLEWKKY